MPGSYLTVESDASLMSYFVTVFVQICPMTVLLLCDGDTYNFDADSRKRCRMTTIPKPGNGASGIRVSVSVMVSRIYLCWHTETMQRARVHSTFVFFVLPPDNFVFLVKASVLVQALQPVFTCCIVLDTASTRTCIFCVCPHSNCVFAHCDILRRHNTPWMRRSDRFAPRTSVLV
jgi:hypothetical protein